MSQNQVSSSPTDCIAALNKSLEGSGTDDYGSGLQDRTQAYSTASGYGVMIRGCLDGQPIKFPDNRQSQIVGTLLHNDINCPSMVYPYSTSSKVEFNEQPTLVAVWDMNPNSDVRHMQDVFPYMTTAKTDKTWGWGVFYAHDSNCLDKRAYPAFAEWVSKINGVVEPNPNGDWGYDGPYGWKHKEDNEIYFTPDSTKIGPADKKIGNPAAYFDKVNPNTDWKGTEYGAGAGIHVFCDYFGAWKDPGDQYSNAWVSTDKDTLGKFNDVHSYSQKYKLWRQSDFSGWWGEMNYDLKSNGEWLDYLNAVAPFTKKIKDQYAQDWILPWVNNFQDLINLNTALAKHRDKANGFTPNDEKLWGWNEIPICRTWQEANKVTLFALVLPQNNDPSKSSIQNYLSAENNAIIWQQLDKYKNELALLGQGSFVAICQQTRTKTGHFYKQFILEDFSVTLNGATYSVTNGKLAVP